MYRSQPDVPRARLPLLEQVTIKTPCRESWDAMTGDDRTRFCARCSKNVYDLSAMTQDEAEAFLATHLDDEDACVRLYRRPDGRVLTSECVQGTRGRHARKVAAGIAAGLCAVASATVALANVHVPDGRNLPKVRARIDVNRHAGTGFDRSADDVTIPSDEVASTLLGTTREDVTGAAMGGIGFERPQPRASVRETSVAVSDGYAPDVVRRIVRQNLGRARLCYQAGLERNPDLAGSVDVRFLIGSDGDVIAAHDGGSTLADESTAACIRRGFAALSFPAPDGARRISVSYRVSLRPTL